MKEQKPTILIVDDEADIRSLIKGILEDEGYHTVTAANAKQSYEAMTQHKPDLVILDIWLQNSDQDGIEILTSMRRDNQTLPVIMISGHGTIETAVSSIKQGAYDFIEKPFKSDRLILMIRRALETASLVRENIVLKKIAGKKMDLSLTGKSSAIQSVRQLIERFAPTNSRVLITGEPGTGKEMTARLMHKHSKRTERPFLILNCATMQPGDLEPMLFGAEATGSEARTLGLLERAHGGSLFFDEVADMPLETQGKIVRVIQEQTFLRVGGVEPVHVDVRIFASTNRNLEELVESGRFRKDLFYRLNVVPLHMPCLRERVQDIPELVHTFGRELAEESGLPNKEFAPSVLSVMQSYDWPGNIRQLKNAVEWMMIMSGPSQSLIDTHYLPPDLQHSVALSGRNDKSEPLKSQPGSFSSELLTQPLREAREEFERFYLLAQIKRFEGNVSKTAKFVGMERSALHRKLKSLNVTTALEDDDAATNVTEITRKAV